MPLFLDIKYLNNFLSMNLYNSHLVSTLYFNYSLEKQLFRRRLLSLFKENSLSMN